MEDELFESLKDLLHLQKEKIVALESETQMLKKQLEKHHQQNKAAEKREDYNNK